MNRLVISCALVCLMLSSIALMIGCGTSSTQTPTQHTARPSGTYEATAMGFTSTLTFKGDTLEMTGDLVGKHICKYQISADGTTIIATDVATGEVSTTSFKYVKEYDIVVAGGVEFYHK